MIFKVRRVLAEGKRKMVSEEEELKAASGIKTIPPPPPPPRAGGNSTEWWSYLGDGLSSTGLPRLVLDVFEFFHFG